LRRRHPREAQAVVGPEAVDVLVGDGPDTLGRVFGQPSLQRIEAVVPVLDILSLFAGS
jgi:hypothetical protein